MHYAIAKYSQCFALTILSGSSKSKETVMTFATLKHLSVQIF